MYQCSSLNVCRSSQHQLGQIWKWDVVTSPPYPQNIFWLRFRNVQENLTSFPGLVLLLLGLCFRNYGVSLLWGNLTQASNQCVFLWTIRIELNTIFPSWVSMASTLLLILVSFVFFFRWKTVLENHSDVLIRRWWGELKGKTIPWRYSRALIQADLVAETSLAAFTVAVQWKCVWPNAEEGLCLNVELEHFFLQIST